MLLTTYFIAGITSYFRPEAAFCLCVMLTTTVAFYVGLSLLITVSSLRPCRDSILAILAVTISFGVLLKVYSELWIYLIVSYVFVMIFTIFVYFDAKSVEKRLEASEVVLAVPLLYADLLTLAFIAVAEFIMEVADD